MMQGTFNCAGKLTGVLTALSMAWVGIPAVFAQDGTPVADRMAAVPPRFDLSASQEGYLLGPGDRLTVKVSGSEDLSGAQIVLADGTLFLPLIGAISVTNRTLADLTTDIEHRMAAFVRKPRVILRLDALRPIRISVGGEVLQPGPRQIQNLVTGIGTAGSNTLPTVSTALVSAGGVTNQADVSNILLTRQLANGQTATKSIDLWKTLQEGRIEEDLFLRDGDSLFVPVRPSDSPIDLRLLTRTTLAPQKIRIRVFGEVNKPITADLDARSTVIDAVASAGGMTNVAAPDNVEVISLEPDGKVTNRVINVNRATQGDSSQNLLLRDQDVVIVRRSFGGEALNALNTIAGPISTFANLFFIFRNFRQ